MDSNNKIMDLKLELNNNGIFDFVLENGGIAFDYSINTLINDLIFTNRLDLDYPLGHKEGWKGGERYSYVWKYKHHSATEDTALGLKDAIRNALQPLIDNEICSNITVDSTISSKVINITITYSDIKGNETGKYYVAFKLSSTGN